MASTILVGNAPCSWGALEFEETQARPIPYAQVLDELAETGYAGTELGDWGFLPTDPDVLAQELARRRLQLTGAFVPVALKDPASHEPGKAQAVQVADLLAQVARRLAQPFAPFLVLADDNGTDPVRTQNAGRIRPEMGLSPTEWRIFAQGAEEIARAVREAAGLETVFHHHCAGFVETPAEIQRFLELTDPALVGLVLDTGHYVYGSGSNETRAAEALERFQGRVRYVHFKDCHPEVAQRARGEGWDYFRAVAQGVFCELGQGCVDFPEVVAWLKEHDYQGWVTVEQDVLPGMGTPKESAQRNREYLRRIGL